MELIVNIYIFWAKKATIDINIGYYHKKTNLYRHWCLFPSNDIIGQKKDN